MDKKIYDIAVIGGGPAGLTAALYSSRAGMKTVLLEKAQPGGQLWWSEKIENYPGFPEGVASGELASRMREQAEKFGAEVLTAELLEIGDAEEGVFTLRVSGSGGEILSRCVIAACGAKMKQIGVPGEKKLSGKGVSYCAVCDGPLFKGKKVAVIGGGTAACEEAVFLSRFASEVYLVHRRPRLRAVGRAVDRVNETDNIKLMLDKRLVRINGGETVESLEFEDGSLLETDGVFIFAGLDPSTGALEKTVDTREGFILTDESLRSSRSGIYVAGDCRYGALRQVVSACGEGAAAAEQARAYVEKLKGEAYDW